MIPQKLSDWTVEVVTEILVTKRFETETFDFKEMLPNSRENKPKERLKKTCCAFANSEGGFIVFGVSDDKRKKPKDRIIGLDPKIDFPEHFGNYPKACSPSIYWTFLNPPLTLPNNNVIHIAQIPKSWNAPHASGDNDAGWHFTKRTNKGNEGMNTEEIRQGFLGYYEKRLKLQLLRSELVTISQNAQSGYVSEEEKIDQSYSLMTFETNIMESIITDTYSITSGKLELLKLLNDVRHQVSLPYTIYNNLNKKQNLTLARAFRKFGTM
jgi:predicted HTH transcriptional regulator